MVRKLLVLLILAALVLAACGGDDDEKKEATATPEPATPTVQAAEAGITLVMADISNEPTEVFPVFQPLADYLGANLAAMGVSEVIVKVAPDIETMAEWMKTGEVDLYFDSLYPSMIVIDASGAKPILRRWKGGTESYHTVFYTTADSPVQSLTDLKGKKIAFEEEFSTSGFMIPMAYLIEAGLTPVELTGPDDPVGADEVGYVFAQEDSNIIEWLARGRVDAAVNDNQVYPEVAAESPVELRILLETEEVPRQLVNINGALDPALIEAIKALLMGLDELPDGAAILEAFDETAQFDEFPEGIDAALARMQELYDTVQNR